jgi:peptidoglycan/xylan/chitin deacetylase (PgdA/CDA1 family)
MYHRVATESRSDRYTVSARDFGDQMHALQENNYRVISLETAILDLGKPEAASTNSVCVTFDDGFRDTHLHAAPVLEKLRYPATFFLVSGFMGKMNSWEIESRADHQYPLMGWTEAKELYSAGFELGSHTATHPILTQVSAARAAEEIENSKREIEAQLNIAVRYFAYPHGRFDQRIRDLVHGAGYRAACSTLSGFANEDNDFFALRRIEIFGNDSLRTFRRKLKFGANEINSFDVARYYAKRALARCVPTNR